MKYFEGHGIFARDMEYLQEYENIARVPTICEEIEYLQRLIF